MACCFALTITGCDHDDFHDHDGTGALGPDPARDEGEASPRSGGDWGCRTCGYTNSPLFGTHPIDRFVVKGGPAWAELRLTELEQPGGTRHTATVDGQELVAYAPWGSVTGPGLVGWTLVLNDGVTERLVEITGFQEHEDWVDGQMIPTYALAYDDPATPDGPMLNVCPGLDPDQTSVVLITDELYDIDTKEVAPHQVGWVTMACRGHALAKLKFLGYDPNDQYHSEWSQRQAALKAITADYCANGHSFTAIGQPLMWIDQLGNFPEHALPGEGTVEAKWSENGALCLDEPRLVARWEVEDWCHIPYCTDDTGNDPMDLGDALWMTLVP